MSTSMLYHGFGVRGYKYRRSFYEGRSVIFEIEKEFNRLRCSECGSKHVIRRGAHRRIWFCLPIGDKPVYILLDVPRIECLDCGTVRQIRLGFASPRRTYTKSFERYVLGLLRCMTILDVSRHLGVSWDVIKDIQKRKLKKRFSKPKLKKLKRIAIDEIAVKKGHNYLTVVLDLGTGAVVFVGDGKGADALAPFWRRLKHSRARIEAVACDMSTAYIKAVTENLPKAVLVFDRFHVVKLMNEKLSKLRRELHREADALGKKLLKGTRWLLLKNPENLDEEKNERKRLDDALAFNQPLAEAYWMKEQLRMFWEQPDKTKAEMHLKQWCDWATGSGIRILIQMANTLSMHRYGLLNWYDYPISTGPLEGVNNKIKTMKRQAYGYRDTEFFKLKIMALHETKYALVG